MVWDIPNHQFHITNSRKSLKIPITIITHLSLRHSPVFPARASGALQHPFSQSRSGRPPGEPAPWNPVQHSTVAIEPTMVNMVMAMIVGVTPQVIGGFHWKPPIPSLSDCLEKPRNPDYVAGIDGSTLIVHGTFKLVRGLFGFRLGSA